MIDQQERDRIVLLGEAAQGLERTSAGIRPDDAIVRSVFGAQISFDGAEDLGIVIDCKNYWPWQGRPPSMLSFDNGKGERDSVGMGLSVNLTSKPNECASLGT
jgi:hypothetical protein